MGQKPHTRFTFTLDAGLNDPRVVQWLKHASKQALRVYGLKCLGITQEVEE